MDLQTPAQPAGTRPAGALGIVMVGWLLGVGTAAALAIDGVVLAFLVAASAFGAVVLYTYADVGTLAGLPNTDEPSWGPPGKLLSAVAEGAAVLLALGGLAWALRAPWRRAAP